MLAQVVEKQGLRLIGLGADMANKETSELPDFLWQPKIAVMRRLGPC
jgi:hypothetical protein